MTAGSRSSTSAAAPAAASSAVAAVLTGTSRPVRVLATFPAASYVEHDAGLLALVAADGVHHPNAVVLGPGIAERPFARLYTDQRGTVGGGGIQIGDLDVTVARWFDPVPRLRATSAQVLTEHLETATSHLASRTGSDSHPLAGPTAVVVDRLRRGDAEAAIDAAARGLIGAGPGLTPAGDDVLSGLFSAVMTLAPVILDPLAATALTDTTRDAGVLVVERARQATTAVSAELLHHAVRGEVAAPAATVLHALTGRRPVAPALDALLAIGATSGRDLTYGLLAGAALVLAAVAPQQAHAYLSPTTVGAT